MDGRENREGGLGSKVLIGGDSESEYRSRGQLASDLVDEREHRWKSLTDTS